LTGKDGKHRFGADVGTFHTDQASIWLETACEERFHRLAYVNVEAFWDPLRSNRRYADLPRRIGQLSSFSTTLRSELWTSSPPS
jgi:hypothetical protein